MADKVYSYTKISKRYTKTGRNALTVGIVSLSVLVGLIGWGIFKQGEMHGIYCLLPYLTMVLSIIWTWLAKKERDRMDRAGKYLTAGYRLCLVSSVLHGTVYFIGILKIIL